MTDELSKYMDEQYRITRIKHDSNGNGRLVVSWLAIPGASTYAEAVKIANTIGGRKYHTKSYGGGIVFQAYGEGEVKRLIASLASTPEEQDNTKRMYQV